MKKIIIFLITLFIIPLINADHLQINYGGAQEIIISPFGLGEIGFFPGAILAEEEEEEGVTGGGAGAYNITGQIEEISTIEEFSTSLKICVEQKGGIPVNVKGSIFCKITGEINDTYIPIELLLKPKITLFGKEFPDLGSFISKDNPVIGWIILAMISVALALFIIEQRRIIRKGKVRRRIERFIKQQEKEEEKE